METNNVSKQPKSIRIPKWVRGVVFACTSFAVVSVATANTGCPSPKDFGVKGQIFRARLQARGYQVKAVQLTGQCYEMYSLERAGQGYEIYFDPSSGSWWWNRSNLVTRLLHGT